MGRNVVDFEPENALFVPDDDPLIFYRKMAQTGVKRLFFEINENFGNEICELLESMNYQPELRKDINGRDRMICGIKKE